MGWAKFTGGDGRFSVDALGGDAVKVFATIFRGLVPGSLDDLSDREVFDSVSRLARAGFIDIRLKVTPTTIEMRSQLMQGGRAIGQRNYRTFILGDDPVRH